MDYKTYHQAGSSLRWLFAGVPLSDLDARPALRLPQLAQPLFRACGPRRVVCSVSSARGQLGVRCTWGSWLGDWPEPDRAGGLCRVYAATRGAEAGGGAAADDGRLWLTAAGSG
jgi:hypothetical protein